MELQTYDISEGRNSKSFWFTSKGVKGDIRKLVLYQETSIPYLYNLAFGDLNPNSGELDDSIVTDNGDGEKVLATVVSTIYHFFRVNPSALVYLTGSSPSRTRLYRIAIAKYLPVFEEKFEILGELSKGWERFESNRKYEGFFIKLK
ncbi:MAG: hypothetical protein IPL23_17020 [Saprospiraceae bacterium]|nr:hypothetical protein [Saprospiraceae bacterium]